MSLKIRVLPSFFLLVTLATVLVCSSALFVSAGVSVADGDSGGGSSSSSSSPPSTAECAVDADCPGDSSLVACTVLRQNLGICVLRGELLSPCSSDGDCTGTVDGEALTCRTLADEDDASSSSIMGSFCALPAASHPAPVPDSLVCSTDSNACALSGGSCIARTTRFGSSGICIPVQESTAKACTIGGVACPAGSTCSAQLATIGAVGICVPSNDTSTPVPPADSATGSSVDGGLVDDPSTPSAASTATDGEVTPISGSTATGAVYCSCSCNGMMVPGYMNYLVLEGCSACNSKCWGALFSGCTSTGWQSVWGDTTNIYRGTVFGTCLGPATGGGSNDGGDTDDGLGIPPVDGGSDGGSDNGGGLVFGAAHPTASGMSLAHAVGLGALFLVALAVART